MKITVFSSRLDEREFLSAHPSVLDTTSPTALEFCHTSVHLDSSTAHLAAGSDAVCAFVNDNVDEKTIKTLKSVGTRCILLRCAGYNQVDVNSAAKHGVVVLRVPAYSPHAVAEFAVALLLTVGRKTHKAYNRTRESNFALRGLMGFDVHGKTVGICGTGKIGRLFAKIILSFGTRVIAYDVRQSKEAKEIGVEYVTLDQLWQRSDIISMHCPLLPATRHMINEDAVNRMKKGVILINTSRGELVDMDALINGLRSKTIGACAMDVVEGEEGLFFDDHSGEILDNERISKLVSFPNVVLTPHIAFCTDTAMKNIWTTTVANALEFANHITGEGKTMTNQVMPH
eukprot:GFKZ01006109.1.p1 GENE.GFKZ01006109.1~~GFKZ01006109.1.p1  ORF type:complete len:343 (-),score=36.68 GFKZ01006109.1:552-1580(-)